MCLERKGSRLTWSSCSPFVISRLALADLRSINVRDFESFFMTTPHRLPSSVLSFEPASAMAPISAEQFFLASIDCAQGNHMTVVAGVYRKWKGQFTSRSRTTTSTNEDVREWNALVARLHAIFMCSEEHSVHLFRHHTELLYNAGVSDMKRQALYKEVYRLCLAMSSGSPKNVTEASACLLNFLQVGSGDYGAKSVDVEKEDAPNPEQQVPEEKKKSVVLLPANAVDAPHNIKALVHWTVWEAAKELQELTDKSTSILDLSRDTCTLWNKHVATLKKRITDNVPPTTNDVHSTKLDECYDAFTDLLQDIQLMRKARFPAERIGKEIQLLLPQCLNDPADVEHLEL